MSKMASSFGLGQEKDKYTPFMNKWVYIDLGSSRQTGVLCDVNTKLSYLVLSPFLVSDYHGSDIPVHIRIDPGQKIMPLGDQGICVVSEEIIKESVRNCQIDFDAGQKKRAYGIKKLEDMIAGRHWWAPWRK